MVDRNESSYPYSWIYLVTAIIWGVTFVASVWMDFYVRSGPLLPWRKLWDFLITPGLCALNVFLYQKPRPKERKCHE